MSNLIVVTGANGHLGHVLLRTLLNQGATVRATVRDPAAAQALFAGLRCEVAAADILDKAALCRAFAGADTIYQTAAVFKLWAKNPKRDIIDVNIAGTRNVLEAAAEMDVRQVVYVSSVAALDVHAPQWSCATWNPHPGNPYMRSKTHSEQLAWELVKSLQLNMVSILPSSIIGPSFSGRLTPNLEFLLRIARHKLPIDPNFGQMFVDVRDVVSAMIAAAHQERYGQRYLLSHPTSTNTADVFAAAHAVYPDIRIPPRAPKVMLKTMAYLFEAVSKIFNRPAPLTAAIVDSHYGKTFKADITSSQRDLDFAPRPVSVSLTDTFRVLRGDLDPSVVI